MRFFDSVKNLIGSNDADREGGNMGKVTEEEQAAAREKEKRDRFVRVVPFRCRKVLKAIAAVGKCGNRSQYSYTDEEIDEIFGKIDEAVDEAKAAFIGEKPKETVSFSFE